MNTTQADEAKALEVLRDNQQQLDQDGIMVGVSRQAINETLTYIADLRTQLADAQKQLAEAVEQNVQTMVHYVKNEDKLLESNSYFFEQANNAEKMCHILYEALDSLKPLYMEGDKFFIQAVKANEALDLWDKYQLGYKTTRQPTQDKGDE